MDVNTESSRMIHSDGSREWTTKIDGEDAYHRLDGPAWIGADGVEEWWVNGVRHQLDGPAEIDTYGWAEWWIDGRLMTSQIKEWMIARDVTWPWDESIQVEFALTWG